MYSSEKSLRKGERLKRNPQNSPWSPNLPSFSSSLLDQIFRSIDDGNEKMCEELKSFCKDRIVKKPSNGGGGVNAKRGSSSNVEDEETARIRRACDVEKWMEKKVGNKFSDRRRQSLPEYDGKSRHRIGDPLFFSSSSSSSDSSSGGFSSSDTEVLSMARSTTSCFTISTRLKPVRTGASAGPEKFPKDSHYEQSEHHVFDNCPLSKNREDFKHGGGLIKSKLKASKIYGNLKKVKQPISPGGKLASFLNSLFTNGNTKNTKKNSSFSNGDYENAYLERNAKFTQTSNCSSAFSYSRSCLTKTCKISSNSKEKSNDGAKRTVRFCPESATLDEDRLPCGHKCIYKDNRKKFVSPTEEELNLQVLAEEIRKIEQSAAAKGSAKSEAMARNQNAEDDEDDAASDSSSDLFELDHLAFGGNHHRYYCEELPLYETTRLDMDLAIAGSLIR